MHTCVYVNTYACKYVCINICMYVCMYVFMHICKYICMHVYMYVLIYVRVCMYVWGSIQHNVAWRCVWKGMPLVEAGEIPALGLARPALSNRRHWLLCQFSALQCSEQFPSSIVFPIPTQSQINPVRSITPIIRLNHYLSIYDYLTSICAIRPINYIHLTSSPK